MADSKQTETFKPQMTLCPRCRGKKKFCQVCQGKRLVPIKITGIKREE